MARRGVTFNATLVAGPKTKPSIAFMSARAQADTERATKPVKGCQLTNTRIVRGVPVLPTHIDRAPADVN
eukprot:10370928-Lingulodinium_polyedra.AAC.1